MTKGERIIGLREKRGLSQVELADRIGVSGEDAEIADIPLQYEYSVR